MNKWDHDALAVDLAGYLSGADTMVWTDMQLGPSGSPRPDVFTLRRSYSKPMPMAFECKISRSDLRSDTTSGKWQSYLKYAGGVTFAVPDGLCTVSDIPNGCGLIVRKAEVWRYARRPTLNKVTPPFEACMKLLIDGINRTYVESPPKPRRVELWRESEAIRKRFGKDVAEAARNLTAAHDRLASMKAMAASEWERHEREIKVRADLLKRRFEEEEAVWAAARKELLDWLEMDNGSVWSVQRRIQALKAECSVDGRVRAAEGKLHQARVAVQSALNVLGDVA